MRHIIVGTAGHVDHGKTALVKALTGIDTDRLKEEKERGITIELGFASLVLDNGRTVGIIDVPGHERFVKNMVAGAGGIDLVVMVIAADEVVMPQTREHLEICELLDIKKGIVALTKTDLVDDEWRGLAEEDVREFLKGTFLEEASIVPVSALTGEGIADLRKGITTLAENTEYQRHGEFFRLPVDRVFTMKGFGTVVTGTLISGSISVGDIVQVMPDDRTAKIRGIQVHGESVEKAEVGQRTAINLQGIEKTSIERGEILTQPDVFSPTNRIDVFLRYLNRSGKKLKNRSRVRFHSGTSEIMARIILLGKTEMAPGESCYGQILLDEPTVVMSKDKFVLRSYSPITTIGGGDILDPLATKIKSFDEVAVRDLARLAEGSDDEKTVAILNRAGIEGITPITLALRTGLSLKRQDKIVEDLLSRKEAILIDREERRLLSQKTYNAFIETIRELVTLYHKKFPLKEGISREELKGSVARFVNAKIFSKAMIDLEQQGLLVIDQDSISLPEHRVSLSVDMEDLKESIIRWYRKNSLSPPTTKDVKEAYPGKEKEVANVLEILVNNGTLLKISSDLLYDATAIARLREAYRALLLKKGKTSLQHFKDLTGGLTRKFLIPLMEYYDATKLTIRVGDHRILREGRNDNS